MNDESPEAACTGASGAKPRPKVPSNYGGPPLRKGNALKAHHVGLVICLIILELKTHAENSKRNEHNNMMAMIYLFNADKSSYTCHNINSVIT